MNVEVNNFNGPLDLLLHLIRSNKMDIYDIDIELITKEYIDYINNNKNLTIDACSEYLVMASELIEMKSKMLLPKKKEKEDDDYDNLIGIRYFSCASVKASDMGFNYVFPTSGRQKSYELPYCAVLTKAFRLTNPVYIHEYDNISACEWKLSKSNNYDHIH